MATLDIKTNELTKQKSIRFKKKNGNTFPKVEFDGEDVVGDDEEVEYCGMGWVWQLATVIDRIDEALRL